MSKSHAQTHYLDYIDTQTPGERDDISPLFRHAEATNALVTDLIAPFEDLSITHVAGIDALGFILGSLVAQRLDVGFIAIRKGDKLPVPANRREFIDSTGHFKSLEVRKDIVSGDDRILVVDDWIETGAQMTAAVGLLNQMNAHIVGVAAVCIDRNEHTAKLRDAYHCHDVWRHEDGEG